MSACDLREKTKDAKRGAAKPMNTEDEGK